MIEKIADIYNNGISNANFNNKLAKFFNLSQRDNLYFFKTSPIEAFNPGQADLVVFFFFCI